ncbi:beta-hexosaminidase subunit alpha-like isoform X2 [Penaeus chinensis]|uniref:beta-hexosaminidase subunit alpha-like isoform X2 n=1 Tax=Penaeus chinensis TaxID=139456 RepID=UPI001FB7DCF4|nr:beta-hexosaminidase subunit alpha-like isoform X2 [Penaeus chinensis]
MYRVCLILLAFATRCAIAGFPSVLPTKGEVWPRPQMSVTSNTYMVIRPETFRFTTVGHDCDILKAALKRYIGVIFASYSSVELRSQPWRKDGHFRGYLDNVKVNLIAQCEELPHRNMDEHYEIKIDSPDAPTEGTIVSQSVWGILRGLESFSQLLLPSGSAYVLNSTQIMDFPRFSFRGLMLDTARHFLPVSKLKENLDLMAMNKFNVFHWHLVDDQSFPYESAAFPNLSKLGSYSSSHVYSAADVADVVEYARLRGIRVLPEFDTPGHTKSWGPGQPGLLTKCYTNSTPDGTFGPIDPTNDANYKFLQSFFTEVTHRFPDHYVHLGGDEVSFSCWESNPAITQFMAEHNITGNYSKLEEIYVTKLLDIVANLPTKNGYLVWQEVFDNRVEVAKDTVVHVWKNSPTWKQEIDEVTSAGYQTVLSSCWYLNYISYGIDWHKYYECDPQEFNGTAAQQQLVLGGEACMWGEYVDRTNVISRTWPRAAVVAEKLWSAAVHTTDAVAATPRLEEHRCRLLGRGYDVEPLWPSFCPSDL